ncbi:MAG TPA: MFS transporter [Gaiellaceae bacterium]|nr:MFS transporter [Gaiellaceae bacterium]
MPSPLRRQLALLRRSGSFRLLFVATLGSGLGTWMATIALTADLTARTHSPWWVSLLFIVTFLPSIVVGLFFGPLVDRLSRKQLIINADLVRLVVFVVLVFVHTPVAIIVLATIAGIANSFFRPAVLAGVPNLVAEDELAHGTSVLQATDWAATAIGPVIGGVIVGTWSADVVYWINAATFLFSALLILKIPARLLQSEQAITRGHWRDLADGISAFRRSPALQTVLFAFSFAMFAAGLNNVAEIFLAEDALHRGAFGYGLLWSAAGVGLVIGSLVSGSLLEKRDMRVVYPLVFLPWAAGLLGAGIAPNLWVAAAAMVLAGVGNGLAFPLTVVIVQRNAPDSLRGRVFTVIISAHNAVLGVGMVTAGALTEAAGPRWTYGLASALLVLASVTAFVLFRARPATGSVEPAT